MAELKYEQIRNTEIWAILKRKSAEQGLGHEFIAAVEKVCTDALDLSQHIVRIFPTYTLHNDIHSANVCNWMFRLLGNRAEELTAQEAALLIMAACCHDIGMSVSKDQEKKLRAPTFSGWKKHFENNWKDKNEFSATGTISDGMLRNFVRQNHHTRIREHLMRMTWPAELTFSDIKRDTLVTLCESHGTALSLDKLTTCDEYDLLLCAVLLRLADLLDYDASRSPEILFRHMGLDDPETAEEIRSAVEQTKNRVGKFGAIKDGVIRYNAVFKNLQQEKDVRDYLDWVKREMDRCRTLLGQTASHWKGLPLPYKISTDGADRDGYEYGEFCMTMDQDKVIKLLTGEHLYSDPGVFVRELLQNAIDAVLMRVKQEKAFTVDQGRIIIDTWPAGAGDTWFRIRDNGVGMNQHIITNYFLKVGRSYYTSEEFRAANRRADGGEYTAISRFGIGILSCFMVDPEHTELKVSTKRFQDDDENGIRLDVTGLHGYYYLAHERKHPDYAASFLEMPSPDDDNRGYREEPGTTICVRTNLFRMGNLKSFRQILDKYVHFPEVRVEYNGPNEHKEYPTQQDLMGAVYALNPGGVVKEYVHPLPPKEMKLLKDTFPIISWDETPQVALQYYPLDWASDSENMTGVSINAELRWPNRIRSDLNLPRGARAPELKVGFSFGNEIGIQVQLFSVGSETHEYLWSYGQRLYTKYVQFPRLGTDSVLDPLEQKVLDWVIQSHGYTQTQNSFTAYQGVMADQNNTYRHKQYSRAVLLLRNDFLPEVTLARDKITGLSLEAACCLTMLTQKIKEPLIEGEGLTDRHTRFLATERDFWEILQRHPRWQTRDSNTLSLTSVNLQERWELAAAKYRHIVQLMCEDKDHDIPTFLVTQDPGDKLTADFPVQMFFRFPPKIICFASFSWGRYYYNRDHIFSRWLIEKRAMLLEKVPAVYDTLIETMMHSGNTKLIFDTVNATLTRLRGFNGNCFGVCEDLFLQPEDFH